MKMNREQWIAEAMRLAGRLGVAYAEVEPHEIADASEAIRAHLSTVPSVPDGWVMVPEANRCTSKQLAAGAAAIQWYEPAATALAVYNAMVSTAPKQENSHDRPLR
jgi:hypothetical protein